MDSADAAAVGPLRDPQRARGGPARRQRVVLLSSRPGRIAREWRIDIPQPRRIEDAGGRPSCPSRSPRSCARRSAAMAGTDTRRSRKAPTPGRPAGRPARRRRPGPEAGLDALEHRPPRRGRRSGQAAAARCCRRSSPSSWSWWSGSSSTARAQAGTTRCPSPGDVWDLSRSSGRTGTAAEACLDQRLAAAPSASWSRSSSVRRSACSCGRVRPVRRGDRADPDRPADPALGGLGAGRDHLVRPDRRGDLRGRAARRGPVDRQRAGGRRRPGAAAVPARRPGRSAPRGCGRSPARPAARRAARLPRRAASRAGRSPGAR